MSIRCVLMESIIIKRGGKRRVYLGKMVRKINKKKGDEKIREKIKGRFIFRRLSFKFKKIDWFIFFLMVIGRFFGSGVFSKFWICGDSSSG